MAESLSDFSLGENLTSLRPVFEEGYGSVYLRGSLLRREPPYDDLDIIEISDEPHAQLVPRVFRGAQVAYRHLTQTEWEEYLNECPRSWYMYYDLLPLHRGETAADIVYARGRDEFFANKETDHLVYLSYESKLPPMSNADLAVNYESLKNVPGSKRSIMRGVFMLKALHPGTRNFTTPDLLMELAAQGSIPSSIPVVANEIYGVLSEQPIDTARLSPLARQCSVWMNELLLEVDEEIKGQVPTSYTKALDIALSSQGSRELKEVQESTAGWPEPHRRWIASFVLANNDHLPQSAADNIRDLYRHSYSGRLIRDALLRRVT